MTNDRLRATADGDEIRVELSDLVVTLDPADADALRRDLDEAISEVRTEGEVVGVLVNAPNVGSELAQLLANEYGSLEAIDAANDEELESLAGIGPRARMGIRDVLDQTLE